MNQYILVYIDFFGENVNDDDGSALLLIKYTFTAAERNAMG